MAGGKIFPISISDYWKPFSRFFRKSSVRFLPLGHLGHSRKSRKTELRDFTGKVRPRSVRLRISRSISRAAQPGNLIFRSERSGISGRGEVGRIGGGLRLNPGISLY